MSLHTLANHLQQAGRGEDKVLIHMTPKEVNGLQSLAMAHGGSLTINPQTGLPEAGFLSRLLPTLIGAGLMFIPGMQPLAAAAITGTGYGIAKGSLKEGLMAGLGAYGGAGLASGLSSAGAAAPAANAANATNTAANATNIVPNSGLGVQGIHGGTSSYSGANVIKEGANAGALNSSSLSQPIIRNYPTIDMPKASDVMSRGFVNPPPATQVALQAPPVAPPVAPPPAPAPVPVPDATSVVAKEAAPVTFDNIKAGFGKATNSLDDLKSVWDKTPTGTGYGLAATGMGIMSDMQNKDTGAPAPSDSYLRPYEYSVSQDPNAYASNASTAERKYFTEPRFTALPIQKVKEGGLMSIDSYGIGGAVENMSAMNSVSGNTMYPQSQLQTAMYSNPMMQRPVQNDVINAGLDAPTQPYSGEQRMASGGVATPNGGGVEGNGPLAQLMRQGAFSNTSAPSSYTAPTPSAAYIPQGQAASTPDTSMVPNTQIQPQQNVNQQLGLESFYSNMNQRLADQGGYSSYAAGGVARYNVGGSLTPWATGSSYNPGVPIASGQLYLGNPPPMASAPAASTSSAPTPYVAPKALDPYIPQGQSAGNPDMSMVPNIQLQQTSTPEQQLGLGDFYAKMNQQLAQRGGYSSYAAGGGVGGVSTLGGYSDGGRLLRGPGDGVSDSIPASIGDRQPARLADGEFVVPARIVSEIGNGSTEAGARKLYAMMDRVQKARGKTTGKNKVAVNTKADKLLPA